jgi:hypothetical protein
MREFHAFCVKFALRMLPYPCIRLELPLANPDHGLDEILDLQRNLSRVEN